MSSENAREIYKKINPQMLLLCPVAKFEYRLGLLTKSHAVNFVHRVAEKWNDWSVLYQKMM